MESDDIHEPLFTFSYRDAAARNKTGTKQREGEIIKKRRRRSEKAGP